MNKAQFSKNQKIAWQSIRQLSQKANATAMAYYLQPLVSVADNMAMTMIGQAKANFAPKEKSGQKNLRLMAIFLAAFRQYMVGIRASRNLMRRMTNEHYIDFHEHSF